MITPAPLRILVVDDRDENRQVLRWMLREALSSPEILEAPTAEEATRLLESERVDCVVLDAESDHFETLRQSFASRRQETHLPLVVLARGEVSSGTRLTSEEPSEQIIRRETLSAQTFGLTVRSAIEIASLQLMLDEQGRELDRLRESSDDLQRQLDDARQQVADVEASAVSEVETSEAVDTSPSTPAAPADPRVSGDVVPVWEPPAVNLPAGKPLERPKLVTNGFSQQTVEDEDLAHRIQSDLLPPGSPLVDGFDVAGLSIPAAATGGDYYDYLPMSDGLLTITIGECSGRGVAPAMLMASLRAYARVLAAGTADAADIISKVNQLVTEDIGEEEFLVTLLLLQIDQLTKTMRYASAGHQAHLIDRDGNAHTLPSTGMPMGLRSETVIPEGEPRKLRSGDILVLTTDGCQKLVSKSGEQFGVQRILDLVREHRNLPARMIVNYLKNACTEFADPDAQGDDITFVIVKTEGVNLL